MAKSKTDAEVMEGLVADEEGDLGKIGGDPNVNMEQDHGDPDNKAVDEQESKAKKHCIHAASQNTALLVIICTDTPD